MGFRHGGVEVTIIAYRNGVMACDAAWTDDGIAVSRATKIHRLKSGALYGGAGDSDDRALVALLQNVKTAAKLPTRNKLRALGDDVAALLVLPNGEIWQVETDAKGENGAFQICAPYAALGSGRKAALGAMFADASAYRAVEAACHLDANCRPPVFVLRLNP